MDKENISSNVGFRMSKNIPSQCLILSGIAILNRQFDEKACMALSIINISSSIEFDRSLCVSVPLR